jgi:hypothetical protein
VGLDVYHILLATLGHQVQYLLNVNQFLLSILNNLPIYYRVKKFIESYVAFAKFHLLDNYRHPRCC